MYIIPLLVLAEAEKKGDLITPWFKLIADKFLYTWWDSLANLQPHQDHQTIHRM